jgi:hypothetical protein
MNFVLPIVRYQHPNAPWGGRSAPVEEEQIVGFEQLSEEIVGLVAEQLVHVPTSCRVGDLLAQYVRQSVASFSAFVTCCKSVWTAVFLHAVELTKEVRCRAVAVGPPLSWHTGTPFTRQVEIELKCTSVVRTLAHALPSMALHCATTHCTRARRNVNLRASADQIRVAHVAACKVAVCASREASAFLYCCSRSPSRHSRGGVRTVRFKPWQKHASAKTKEEQKKSRKRQRTEVAASSSTSPETAVPEEGVTLPPTEA